MPIPVSLITAIVNALIEVATNANATGNVPPYEYNAVVRTLPEKAKQGVMLPPLGNGQVIIDGQEFMLSPTAQFRSQKNMIVMPFSIQNPSEVVYIADANGAIYRIWMLNPGETAPAPSASP